MPSQIASDQTTTDTILVKAVNEAYSARAKEGVTESYATNVAEAFGYTPQQLQSIPDGANMGLSCGNPVGTANIKEGEVVVDLGSGGGIDIFLAAQMVGSTGQAIGIDGSSDMIALARANARKHGLTPPQCCFVQASLTEPLPLNPNSVDCFLSNCVINLLPRTGKESIFKEMYKVLKPGGRLIIDDTVAKGPFPPNILTELSAHINCVAGAMTVEEYTKLLTEAGFVDVLLVDTKSNFNIYYQAAFAETQGGCCTPANSGCCPPNVTPAATAMEPGEAGFDANKWVAAYQIYALKSSAGTADGVPPSTRKETLLRWWDAYPPPVSQPSMTSVDKPAGMVEDKARGR